MIVRAKRGTRRYRVTVQSVQRDLYRLRPIGDDVYPARDERSGKFQGGVRGRTVSGEILRRNYVPVEVVSIDEVEG